MAKAGELGIEEGLASRQPNRWQLAKRDPDNDHHKAGLDPQLGAVMWSDSSKSSYPTALVSI